MIVAFPVHRCRRTHFLNRIFKLDHATVRIHFSPESLFALNVCLALIVSGVALNIHRDHFVRLLIAKKALFT